MDSGSWLVLELSSYLFVLLSASHHFEESLVNVIIRDRVINGILLKALLYPLILCICVSEASNPALLLASLQGQSLMRHREWSLGRWVRRSLLCQLLTMLIMYPLIIVHDGPLNHLHSITGYWCVTSTMKFAILFLYPAIIASRRSTYDEQMHALTFLNYRFLGLLVPLGW